MILQLFWGGFLKGFWSFLEVLKIVCEARHREKLTHSLRFNNPRGVLSAQSWASPCDDVAPHTWAIQLTPVFQSEAQELTIVKMSKFGGGIGAPSKEERLQEAADIHLRLGQIQRYCELMVELGQVRCRGRTVPHLDSSVVSIKVGVFVF